MTDGQTDRGTDGGEDFTGHCPTNVERPILKHKHSLLHNMNHFFTYKTQVDKFSIEILCNMNQPFAKKNSIR